MNLSRWFCIVWNSLSRLIDDVSSNDDRQKSIHSLVGRYLDAQLALPLLVL